MPQGGGSATPAVNMEYAPAQFHSLPLHRGFPLGQEAPAILLIEGRKQGRPDDDRPVDAGPRSRIDGIHTRRNRPLEGEEEGFLDRRLARLDKQ